MLDKKYIGEKIKKARNYKGEKLGYKFTGKMLADELGISRSFLGDIESGRTAAPLELLEKIISICELPCDYFRESDKDSCLTERDKKDIAKDLNMIMEKLENQEDGPIYFNGNELAEEDKDLFKDALELALKTIKVKNKDKYTPKKYKK